MLPQCSLIPLAQLAVPPGICEISTWMGGHEFCQTKIPPWWEVGQDRQVNWKEKEEYQGTHGQICSSYRSFTAEMPLINIDNKRKRELHITIGHRLSRTNKMKTWTRRTSGWIVHTYIASVEKVEDVFDGIGWNYWMAGARFQGCGWLIQKRWRLSFYYESALSCRLYAPDEHKHKHQGQQQPDLNTTNMWASKHQMSERDRDAPNKPCESFQRAKLTTIDDVSLYAAV